MGNSEDNDNNQVTQDNQEDSTGGQGGGGKRKKSGGADRSAAAKAFYRAMYAGAEPDPEDFGLGEQGGGSGDPKSCAYCQRMQSDLETMEAQKNEAENLYKRLAADFENYRKRMQRERDEFSAAGIQRAIEAILPALDDMDMAKEKLNADMDSKAILDSIKLVYSRFARCLEQIGIKQLDVIGEPFDPKFHEPVQQVVTNDVPDGSVYQQLRPGYLYNDKVLRPSLVNVATSAGDDDVPPSHASDAQGAESESAYEGQASNEPAYDQEQSDTEQQYDQSDEPDQQDLEDDVVTLEPGEFRANLTQELPVYEIGEDVLTEEPVEEEAEK